MRLTDIVLLSLAAATAGLSLGLAILLMQARRVTAAMAADRDRARVSEAATLRVLRLSVTDLRADAMRLCGHAEQLGHMAAAESQAPSPDLTCILSLAGQILMLADDMQDHAVSGASTRRLELESLPLAPVIADAIEAVDATLGPSERHWRVAKEVAGCTLMADRRAINQILSRVLSNAARHSRHGDWIDIGVERRGTGLALVIEDEGAGLTAPRRGSPATSPDNRGLGLGLVLARVLMEAHGGLMAVESAARVGTKVSLSFPPDRVAAMDDVSTMRAAA